MVQPLKKPKILDNAAVAAPAGEKAFTLIELAVVLAILGLLAGGVLGANSYIETAKRTTLINEGKLMQNAFKQFEQKYAAIPGDMADATNHWPASAACPTTGAAGTVCNGDGNNIFGSGNLPEHFYVFRHLQVAGFINGSYTGNSTGSLATVDGKPGVNIPGGAIEGSGMFFSTPFDAGADLIMGTNAGYFEGYYGNGTLFIGRSQASGMPYDGILKPGEMMELDQKFDDGRPNTGWIRSYKSYTNCISGTQYIGTGDRMGCVVIMTAR